MKDDDENVPKFHQESPLSTKQANQVIKAIKVVTNRLSSSNTNAEMLKVKELEGSAEGQKAGASQEKSVAGTNTSFLVPSTGKKHGIQKEKGDLRG